MNDSNRMRWMLRSLCLLGCLAAGLSAEADTLYPKEGAPVRGTIRWKRSAQEYVVDQEGTQMTFARARVDRVEVAKPQDFDAAAKLVADGQVEQAIPMLDKIVSEFEMMQWDAKARDLLGQAYIRKKDFGKAVLSYDELFKTGVPLEKPLEVRKRYWEALTGAQRYDTLQTELDKVIATGTREESAAAQVARGNMNKAKGNVFEALMDYLRTVVLYDQVKEVQPEALYRAAQCMDELRDARSAELKKKLSADYPRSVWAQKLQAGAGN